MENLIAQWQTRSKYKINLFEGINEHGTYWSYTETTNGALRGGGCLGGTNNGCSKELAIKRIEQIISYSGMNYKQII